MRCNGGLRRGCTLTAQRKKEHRDTPTYARTRAVPLDLKKKDPLITESYWLIHFLTDWKSCFSLRQQLWRTHLRKRSRAHLIPGLLRVNLCNLCCVRLHFGLQFFDLSSLLHRPVCHLSVKMASYEIEKIESVLLHWQWNSSPATFHSVASRVHALTFWQLVLHRQEKETGKRDTQRERDRARQSVALGVV